MVQVTITFRIHLSPLKFLINRKDLDISDLRGWVYTFETDTEILTSLVSSARLRPRLKILESRDFLLFFFRDRDKNFLIFETESWMILKI